MEDRYKSRIVVDLLLERINPMTNKKEILLILRQNTGYHDGEYDLPGGHLESNEDIFGAMIREAKEEIGIDVKREELEIVHIMHNYQKGMLKFVFKAEKYEGEAKNAEEDQCEKIEWIEIDNLPENIIPKIKEEIQNIENGIYYSS